MTTNTLFFCCIDSARFACLHTLSSCAPALLLVHTNWTNAEDVNPDGAGHPESFANLSSAVIRGDWQILVSIFFLCMPTLVHSLISVV